MNRRNFLSKLTIGAAVVAVAPKVLIPKEEIAITWSDPIVTDFTELLAMQRSLMNSMAGVPMSRLDNPPYKTGGVIQFIAECNQGLHPPTLCNDITLADFKSWTSSL